jgi:hypothetical protein
MDSREDSQALSPLWALSQSSAVMRIEVNIFSYPCIAQDIAETFAKRNTDSLKRGERAKSGSAGPSHGSWSATNSFFRFAVEVLLMC